MVYLRCKQCEFLEADVAPSAVDGLPSPDSCYKEESIRSRERFPEYIVLCACVYYMYADKINSKHD